eukprot:10848108-Karenia_brevis.AAC.1
MLPPAVHGSATATSTAAKSSETCHHKPHTPRNFGRSSRDHIRVWALIGIDACLQWPLARRCCPGHLSPDV